MKRLTQTVIGACGLLFVPLALSTRNELASSPDYNFPTYRVENVTSLPQLTANEQASAPKEYHLPTYTIKDIAALPEPTHNPIPMMSARYAGMTLKLKFTVNEKGRPERVRLEKPPIAYSNIHQLTFASQMRDQVAKWKFKPALASNGAAVAVKVIMPVQIIKKAGTPNTIAIATLILDDGSSDRS